MTEATGRVQGIMDRNCGLHAKMDFSTMGVNRGDEPHPCHLLHAILPSRQKKKKELSKRKGAFHPLSLDPEEKEKGAQSTYLFSHPGSRPRMGNNLTPNHHNPFRIVPRTVGGAGATIPGLEKTAR